MSTLITAPTSFRILFLILCLQSTEAISLERPESTQPAQNYLLFCAGCHGLTGSGVPNKVPTLTRTLPAFVKSAEGRDFVLRVPGVANSALSDQGVAQVLNWFLASSATSLAEWQPFTAEEVQRARRMPLMSVSQSRRQLINKMELSSEISRDIDY